MVSALNILLVQVQTWRSLLLVARPNPLHVYMFGSSLIFLRNRNLMLPSYPSPWLWSCIKPFYQLAPKAITARCKPQAAEVKRGMPMSIVRLQRLRQPEHFYLPPRTSQTECWTDFVQERRPLLHPSFNDFTRCSSAKENPLSTQSEKNDVAIQSNEWNIPLPPDQMYHIIDTYLSTSTIIALCVAFPVLGPYSHPHTTIPTHYCLHSQRLVTLTKAFH